MTKNHRGPESSAETKTGIIVQDPNEWKTCPVRSFEKYISKLHTGSDYLFQQVNNRGTEGWYKASKMGQDKMKRFMQNLSKLCNLSQHYTNHDIRATGITVLARMRFPDGNIQATSGHKSAGSMAGYQRTSLRDRLDVASTLGQSMRVEEENIERHREAPGSYNIQRNNQDQDTSNNKDEELQQSQILISQDTTKLQRRVEYNSTPQLPQLPWHTQGSSLYFPRAIDFSPNYQFKLNETNLAGNLKSHRQQYLKRQPAVHNFPYHPSQASQSSSQLSSESQVLLQMTGQATQQNLSPQNSTFGLSTSSGNVSSQSQTQIPPTQVPQSKMQHWRQNQDKQKPRLPTVTPKTVLLRRLIQPQNTNTPRTIAPKVQEEQTVLNYPLSTINLSDLNDISSDDSYSTAPCSPMEISEDELIYDQTNFNPDEQLAVIDTQLERQIDDNLDDGNWMDTLDETTIQSLMTNIQTELNPASRSSVFKHCSINNVHIHIHQK